MGISAWVARHPKTWLCLAAALAGSLIALMPDVDETPAEHRLALLAIFGPIVGLVLLGLLWARHLRGKPWRDLWVGAALVSFFVIAGAALLMDGITVGNPWKAIVAWPLATLSLAWLGVPYGLVFLVVAGSARLWHGRRKTTVAA